MFNKDSKLDIGAVRSIELTPKVDPLTNRWMRQFVVGAALVYQPTPNLNFQAPPSERPRVSPLAIFSPDNSQVGCRCLSS